MNLLLCYEELQVLKYYTDYDTFWGISKVLGISPQKACKIYNHAMRKINELVKKKGKCQMNSSKANREITRIIEIFKDYLTKSQYMDIVYSEKCNGYIFLPIEFNPEYSIVNELELLEKPKELLIHIIDDIISDTLEENGMRLDECTEAIKPQLHEKLSEYMKDLPEYEYLIDSVFNERLDNLIKVHGMDL